MRLYFLALAMDLFSWIVLPILKLQYRNRERALFDCRINVLTRLEDEALSREPYVRHPDTEMRKKFARYEYEAALDKEMMLLSWRQSLEWCERCDPAWVYLRTVDAEYFAAVWRTTIRRVEAENAGLFVGQPEEYNGLGSLS